MSDGTDEITLTVTKAGQLSLTCQPPAFERLRDLIVAEAGTGSVSESAIAGAKLIVIQAVNPDTVSLSTQPHDFLALLGCSLVGFVFLVIFAVGFGTIVGWMT